MKSYENLKKKALQLRQKTFLEFIFRGEAHLGGSFSMIETLVYLFEKVLKKKDRFILSKSHASFPLCLLLRKKGLKGCTNRACTSTACDLVRTLKPTELGIKKKSDRRCTTRASAST